MKFAVIIPTLNEASHLGAALQSIPSSASVVVSDGGSTDATLSIARSTRTKVVEGPAGRAAQLNRGAAAVDGDVLLFLHADCVLSPNAYEALRVALVDPRVVGGYFRLRIARSGIGLSSVAVGSNLRARYLGLPYGDQCLFARRSAFDAVGGFPELPLLEDVAFARALRKLGRLAEARATVTTVDRHWSRLGIVPTTLLNWAITLAYMCGVPAGPLASVYRRLRKETGVKPEVRPVAQER
jgi:rSAM/selenodomain-associated transferase 2